MFKKFGKPEFDRTFIRRYIFSEDTQMIGFLSVASMSNNLVMFMPIVMHGWLTCAQISTETLDTPFNLLLVAPVKKVLDLASSNRHEYLKMKCDLEIYLGICLLLGWFIGLSQIVSIILYW
jgi:hypothetical protein